MVHGASGVQRPPAKSSSARRPAASSRPAVMSASICRSHCSARNSSNQREKRSSSSAGSWATAACSSSTLMTCSLPNHCRRWQASRCTDGETGTQLVIFAFGRSSFGSDGMLQAQPPRGPIGPCVGAKGPAAEHTQVQSLQLLGAQRRVDSLDPVGGTLDRPLRKNLPSRVCGLTVRRDFRRATSPLDQRFRQPGRSARRSVTQSTSAHHSEPGTT